MTKSCAAHKGRERDPGRGAALALHGGGAHGAFTWGVLDRLLDEGPEIHAICGVSSGALVGAMLAPRVVRDGRNGACAALRALLGDLIAPAGHFPENSDRDPVIQLTPDTAVGGYHCLTSHTPAAHRVATRNSVQPCA